VPHTPSQWRRNEFESGARGKILVVSLTFLALKVQLVVFVSAFAMVNTDCCFLLAVLLTVPPFPAICKSGGTCHSVPYGVVCSEMYVWICVDEQQQKNWSRFRAHGKAERMGNHYWECHGQIFVSNCSLSSLPSSLRREREKLFFFVSKRLANSVFDNIISRLN